MTKDLPIDEKPQEISEGPSRFGRMQRVPPGDVIRPTRKTNGAGVQAEDTKICVVMVGLPARGKSLIAQKGMYWTMLSECTETNCVHSCSLSSLAFDQGQNLQRRNLSPRSHTQSQCRVFRHIKPRGREVEESSGRGSGQ